MPCVNVRVPYVPSCNIENALPPVSAKTRFVLLLAETEVVTVAAPEPEVMWKSVAAPPTREKKDSPVLPATVKAVVPDALAPIVRSP